MRGSLHFARVWPLALVLALPSCGGSPFPSELAVGGRPLVKARSWSRRGIRGAVYTPRGETLLSASLKVGVIVSTEHESGPALHLWVMEKYRGSPTLQWHESTIPGEACKVGATDKPIRPFIALHVCRSRNGTAACAEVDERLSHDTVTDCFDDTKGCWDDLCARKWLVRRQQLEPILATVLPLQ